MLFNVQIIQIYIYILITIIRIRCKNQRAGEKHENHVYILGMGGSFVNPMPIQYVYPTPFGKYEVQVEAILVKQELGREVE